MFTHARHAFRGHCCSLKLQFATHFSFILQESALCVSAAFPTMILAALTASCLLNLAQSTSPGASSMRRRLITVSMEIYKIVISLMLHGEINLYFTVRLYFSLQ